MQDAWLGKFFESRNLAAPDGRMLYAYRLSESEYRSLRTSLETWVAAVGFNGLVQRDAAFCARFVLLASEWWHREYAGGAWRWDPIIELVSGPDGVDVGSRTACVERGFAFWGHRPVNSGKKFLGTVVAHGGLPLRALGQGIGTVSRILRDSLQLAARYGWQEEQLVAAIGERALSLPESLRKDEIYRLLTTMVLTALELRREYSLAESSDPIALLQARDERWMERFPISLEESAARPLLTDLLKEAAAQKQSAPTAVFSVRRSLMQFSEGMFELQATVSAPRKTSAEQLTGALRLRDVEQLPSYFSVDLSGDPECWLEGRLLLGQAQSVRLDGRTRTLRGLRALDELTVAVRRRATPIGDGPCTLPGGGSVPLDQPWVFAEREGAWLLASVGGARLPEQTVRVALPVGWRATSESADSSVVRVGCARVEGTPDMELLAISGSACVENENERFYIRSGQSVKLTETLIWEGKRLAWQPKRYPAFCGLPKLRRIAEDGSQSYVPLADITWKAVGGAQAALATHAVRGLVDAVVTQGGETHTRTRMLILGDSARIEFKSGREINSGSLRFRGFGDMRPAVLSDGVTGTSEPHGGDLTLNLCAIGTPPESVNVGLTRGNHEVIFTLPFPSTGGRFFDERGQLMKDREQLSLRDLTGCRLRIFDQNPDSPKRYSLRLSLSCSDRKTRALNDDISLTLPANGVAEFRLIDVHRNIETMLSFSDELDAKVRLALAIGDQVASSIEVSRYGAHLEHTEQGLLSLAIAGLVRTGMDALDSVRLMAAPLLHAGSDPQMLDQLTSEGVLNATWRTSTLDTEHGPWLIFPAAESSLAVRPLIWCQQSPKLKNNASELTMAMAEPDATARLVAISGALKAASQDYADSSWDQLDYLCKTFAHLPLSALDVFRVLVSEPAHVVAFALRTEGDVETLCRRLGSELGFVWELTSPDDWALAVKRLEAYFAQRLPAESLATIFPMLLKDRCDKVASALPSMSLVLELACVAGGCAPSSEYTELQRHGRDIATQTCRDMWKGESSLVQSVLLRGHDEQRWPEQHFWQQALQAFDERLAAAARPGVQRHIKELLGLQSGDFKISVANTPVICALWTATGTQTAWWQDGNHRQALRRIRAFDPEWFKQAYLAGLRACLGFGLNPRLFRRPPASIEQNGTRVFTRTR